jgi:hypothetical protein
LNRKFEATLSDGYSSLYFSLLCSLEFRLTAEQFARLQRDEPAFAALYPNLLSEQGSDTEVTQQPVTLYELLKGNVDLDLSNCFQWQEKNTFREKPGTLPDFETMSAARFDRASCLSNALKIPKN